MTAVQELEKGTLQVIGKVFKKDPDLLSRDTLFMRDLLAKSMNLLELQAMLEAELCVDLPTQAVMKARTVGEIIDLVATAK
jgi:acyl carrier protein